MIMPNFIQCFPVFHTSSECKYKVKTITGEIKSDERFYSSTTPLIHNLNALNNILSINSYKVNEDNFPVIELDALNDMTNSKNIVSYKFTIDLSTIESESIL